MAHAVGILLRLTDGSGAQRDATKAEAEAWLWDQAKQAVIVVETREGEIARGLVVVPEMDLS